MAATCTDTSFLFSLFGSDANSKAAQGWVLQSGRPIAVTQLNRFEFTNAVRFAAFRKAISLADALASLAAFNTDLKGGRLQMISCDINAIIGEAERLSERHTFAGGHRSFDILHVTAAKYLRAATFLSFDNNQRSLAKVAGLAVHP